MKRPAVFASIAIAMLIPLGISTAQAAPTASSPASQDGGQIQITTAVSALRTAVGRHFTYRPQLVNTGTTATDVLLAHLNVASLTSDVYVDPEDWSSSRSQRVASLRPGQRVTLAWDIQAVSSGSFDVYVVVLPDGRASAGSGPLVVSTPLHALVAARRTLNAGGSLPVVIAVPALLAIGVLLTRWRVRRAR
jgi:hypothetical protein